MTTVRNVFNFTGNNQTFTVPSGVSSINVKLWGAGGGSNGPSNYGGPGGFSSGTLAVNSGDVLTLIVGEGGKQRSRTTTFGGGGAGGADTFDGFIGASGGGLSGIRIGTSTTFVIIAGGGGGTAGASAAGTFSNGGAGGGTIGIDAAVNNVPTSAPNSVGKGGTQTAGGAGGVASPSGSNNGSPGTSLTGGAGGDTLAGNSGAGGGGGGGFFGGGGGAGQANTTTSQDVAGGGGSGFIGSAITNGNTTNTPENTTFGTLNQSLINPPNTTDNDYIAGVGVGGNNKAGGNGLIVLTFETNPLTISKSVNINYSDVNNMIIYTIIVGNTGSQTLQNVQLIDTVPQGVSFVSNSVNINGVQSTEQPPIININNIRPLSVATVTFSVMVGENVPNPNSVVNNSTVTLAGNGATSNSVTTVINTAKVTSQKLVSNTFATIGDVLTYTLVYKNSDNVTANNIRIIDTLPNGITFNENSITLNGVAITGGNINPPGYLLENGIGGGKTITITFKATVNQVPTPNPFINTAAGSYQYTINPQRPNEGNGGTNTNTVSTMVNFINVTSKKIVDKTFATIGDTITYSLIYTNTGNVTAVNVRIIDTLPTGITFLANSITVNGTVISGGMVNPPGFNLPNGIVSGESVTVTFNAIVTEIPSTNPFINSATASYVYTLNPENPNVNTGGTSTNNVSTVINVIKVNASKFVDENFVTLGEEVTYLLVYDNSGNISANNVIIVDTLPNGINFIENSITVNGVASVGGNINPPGFLLQNGIKAGETVTVTFKGKITGVPNPNPFINSATAIYSYTKDPDRPNANSGSVTTNNVSTEVRLVTILTEKFVDKRYADCNDIIKYIIVTKNNGNVPAVNINFQDTIPVGTEFVNNSMFINGSQQIGATPALGIIIPNIGSMGTVTIEFSVKVIC